MARKPLIYTHEFPYHVTVRCNNREWFSLPLEDVWLTLAQRFQEARRQRGLRIHAFVLMANHYHLLCSSSPEHNLGSIMNWLQCMCSRDLNRLSGRINHVFGGRYHGSLISKPVHYAHVYRYMAQNPVLAGIADRVEDYPYSTFYKGRPVSPLPLESSNGVTDEIVENLEENDLREWLNTRFSKKSQLALAKAVRKSTFKFTRDRDTGKELALNNDFRAS